jgi:hypothetical protein
MLEVAFMETILDTTTNFFQHSTLSCRWTLDSWRGRIGGESAWSALKPHELTTLHCYWESGHDGDNDHEHAHEHED